MSLTKFYYKAIDASGKPFEGMMEAETSEEVGNWLIDRQYYIVSIVVAPLSIATTPFSQSTSELSTKELNYFFLQLSSLINAGCPLILCLQALHRQLPKGPLKEIIKDLKEKLEMGKSFSEALKSHPETFSNLFITMMEVGEVGGIVGQVLEKYSRIFDSFSRIKSKFWRSMIYPAILMAMTFGVATILLLWVFPVFVERLQARGGILPLPTRMLIGISDFFISIFHAFLSIPLFLPVPAGISIPLFLILTIYLIRKGYLILRDNLEAQRILGKSILSIPLVGQMAQMSELSLFSSTLGTMLKCGVPILTSLTAVERAQGNQRFKDTIKTIKEGVARGETVSLNMSRYRDLFPDSLILMADVGERGGNLGEMLEKASSIYERELEGSIETFVSLLEPGLIIFISIFVVLMALAMYLPLFDIIRVLR
ncbi:MAG: type II secretion system F family protein [Candidatus Riflebacteria bacterium]|nr:type II secretion system F family protein [Candidatus Riflebacteria bacterium]